MRLFGIVLALALASCVTQSALPPETALGQIVDDARVGRIDVCHDPRWAAWRFDAGEDGHARLKQLRDRAQSIVKTLSGVESDPYDAALQRERLADLTDIVDAILLAADHRTWLSALAAGEQRLAQWREKSVAISGSGFGAAAARRALWVRALIRMEARRHAVGDVFTGVEQCLQGEPGMRARNAFLQLLLPMLDQGQWPSDARDGSRSAMAALRVGDTPIGAKYLQAHWARLSVAAQSGGIPSGALALLRVELRRDPAPASTPSDSLRRFQQEWEQVQSFLASLPPPASVGEELTRRTRLEQYGRKSLAFGSPADDARRDANDKIWAKITPVDKDNTARVKQLLAKRDWFNDESDGDGSESNGWLIVQHSDLEPDFQCEVLHRMEPLLATGRVLPWDYALLWDRVAVKDKRLQRYGTQMWCKDGAWVAQIGVEEPSQLDARRRAVGLPPWAEYQEYIASVNGSCAR